MLRTAAIALLLAAVIAATYSPMFHAQFVLWDDQAFICQDPHLNPPDLAGLRWHWTHAERAIYTPVTYTVWWLLAQLPGGIRPLPYHLASLAAHWIASCAVFQILRRLTSSVWPALAGALLFALHPLQIEAVAWAAGLKDVLSGALSLIALAVYLSFAQTRPESRSPRDYLRYGAALVAFVLALLAKPGVMSLPLVAAAIEIFWLGNSWRRAAIWLSPWLLVAISIAVVAKIIQPSADVLSPLWARPLVAADALAFYLFKLVFPRSLGLIYGRQPTMLLYPMWHGIPPAAVTWIVPAIVAAAVIYWRRRREIVAAALVFVFALLPMLGLVAFEFQKYSTVADHYVYLAMLGPAMLLAWLLVKFPGRKLSAATIALLAIFAVRSNLQASVWSDSISLYRNAVAIDPLSAFMHKGLGIVLGQQGDVAGATEQYMISLKLHPDSPELLKYVADAQSQMGHGALAANYAQQLIDLQLKYHIPGFGEPAYLYLWRGEICEIWGDSSTGDTARQAYQQAVHDFQESMRLDPDNITAVHEFVEAHQKLDALNPSR